MRRVYGTGDATKCSRTAKLCELTQTALCQLGPHRRVDKDDEDVVAFQKCEYTIPLRYLVRYSASSPLQLLGAVIMALAAIAMDSLECVA